MRLDPDRADTRQLFWCAFGVRFAIGLLVWSTRDASSIALLQDAADYESAADSVAAEWLAGRSSLWLQNATEAGRLPWLMIIGLASIKYLFGGLDVLPILLAIYGVLNAYTPVVVYRIARECGGDRRAALLAGRMVAFLPAFVFWGSALYKDGLVFLMLSLVVLHALRLQRAFVLRSFVILVAALAALYGLRFYLAFLLAAPVSVALLFSRTEKERIGSAAMTLLRQIALVSLFAISLIGVGLSREFAELLPGTMPELLAEVANSRQDLAAAQSGYIPEATYGSVREAAAFLPRGVSYFLVVPLPWQWGSARQNLAIPESVIWLLLYPLAVLGLFRLWRANRPAALLLLLVSISLVLFYGLFAGNIGTTYRMRTQVWLLWTVLAALGWSVARATQHPKQRYRRQDAIAGIGSGAAGHVAGATVSLRAVDSVFEQRGLGGHPRTVQ